MKRLLRHGAGDEARTRYLHLGKVALYQMSYTRIRTTIAVQMVPPVGIAFLRKSHGGCNLPPADCQVPPFDSDKESGKKLVPPVGIEPTTRGFSVPCSTN